MTAAIKLKCLFPGRKPMTNLVVAVQLLRRIWLCNTMDCSMPGNPVLHHLPELNQIHVHWLVMPSNHLGLCCSLLLWPSIYPSIRVFSNESALHIRWPKYWSFSFSINPSNDNQDWFPLGLTGLISLQSNGLLRVFSNTTVQKHQFFGAQFSLWSNFHMTIEKP